MCIPLKVIMHGYLSASVLSLSHPPTKTWKDGLAIMSYGNATSYSVV